jgi:hypothetical protein
MSLRASDADRERAVTVLREHLLAGRLRLEEFAERVEAALQARIAGELAQVLDDLPQIFAHTAGSRGKAVRFTVAVLGHIARRGRLRLRRWAFAASALGDLDFDLRDATTDEPQVTVAVLAAFGNVDIFVPEGVNVDVSGVVIFGHRRDWGREAGNQEAPAVHVRVIGLAATIDVWRVPHDLHRSSYSDIFRTLQGQPRQLPA